jgi:thioredoxin reductase (NADPH)
MLFDILIIGAGPAGLAAAIAAKSRGLTYLVLEKGALVDAIQRFPTNMVFFTTPELLEIGGLPLVTPYEKPTRTEALRYYRRVADTLHLDVALFEPVTRLSRRVDGTFEAGSQPAHGPARTHEARAVVLANGAFDRPNELGVPGEQLPHVSHFYREAHGYFRRRVVVVGGKNSSADAALDLYRSGARVTIVHRGTALGDSIKYWVKPDIENRIKEGSIAALFSTRVVEITPHDLLLEGPAGRIREPADAVLLLTGYRSDTTLLETVGAAMADGAPVHDAKTFETTVPNLYVAGAAVAGRESGKIFIENGRFHGEVVVREIARRLAHR